MNENSQSCCHVPEQDPHDHKSKKFDFIAVFSVVVLGLVLIVHFLLPGAPQWVHHFAHTVLELFGAMWWGVALGILIIGVMNKIPRSYFSGLMGKGDSLGGLGRAVFAGLLLDLCCHGILLVAAKLYERGVSIAQVITFLVASPWNSISLTLILISLIGLKWTVLYILGSALIALMTGLGFQMMEKRGLIPVNPHKSDIPEDFKLAVETKKHLQSIKFSRAGLKNIFVSGWMDGRMIIKWLLFGIVLAASIRTFVPAHIFMDWFGPTMAGLLATLFIATIIEICSEGSAPVAGELFNQAGAPGNGFTFLMAGVATDYTEMLAIREFTKSWKISLLLPVICVPQVLFIGWLMNMAVH